jgi:hypothetical protein
MVGLELVFPKARLTEGAIEFPDQVPVYRPTECGGRATTFRSLVNADGLSTVPGGPRNLGIRPVSS